MLRRHAVILTPMSFDGKGPSSLDLSLGIDRIQRPIHAPKPLREPGTGRVPPTSSRCGGSTASTGSALPLRNSGGLITY